MNPHAVIITAFLTAVGSSALAGDAKEIIDAQALYEEVLKAGLGEPYLAPLHTAPEGPLYLWGGVDPIEVIAIQEEDGDTDPGGTLFISRSGSTLGSTTFPLEVPIYKDGPSATALFKSAANRATYEQMIADGSLVIAFGMNCHWGIISGPATNYEGHSHWAQPGLAAIVVETFKVKSKKVTVVGLNLYSRGDDSNATSKRWSHASTAFLNLLSGHDGAWERRRPYMPILEVN